MSKICCSKAPYSAPLFSIEEHDLFGAFRIITLFTLSQRLELRPFLDLTRSMIDLGVLKVFCNLS